MKSRAGQHQSVKVGNTQRRFAGEQGIDQSGIVGAVDVQEVTITPAGGGQVVDTASFAKGDMAEEGGIDNGADRRTVVMGTICLAPDFRTRAGSSSFHEVLQVGQGVRLTARWRYH